MSTEQQQNSRKKNPSKAIDRFNEIPIKISTFPTEIDKSHPKVYMELGKAPGSQSNPEQKECWRDAIPDFRINYRALEIKPIWRWYKNRHVNQWNKTEGENMHACN